MIDLSKEHTFYADKRNLGFNWESYIKFSLVALFAILITDPKIFAKSLFYVPVILFTIYVFIYITNLQKNRRLRSISSVSISTQHIELKEKNKVVGCLTWDNIDEMYIYIGGGSKYHMQLIEFSNFKKSGNYYIYVALTKSTNKSIHWPRELLQGDYALIPNVFIEHGDKSFFDVAKAIYDHRLQK